MSRNCFNKFITLGSKGVEKGLMFEGNNISVL